jgi:hypothetical protein
MTGTARPRRLFPFLLFYAPIPVEGAGSLKKAGTLAVLVFHPELVARPPESFTVGPFLTLLVSLACLSGIY